MAKEIIPDSIKAISHPNRQKILQELKSGKKTAKELMNIIRDFSTYTLYYHLHFLEEKGFINSESIDNEKHYSININKADLSAYESMIELISELQIDDQYELIKISIPDDSQLLTAVESKLQELNALISSVKGETKNYLIFLKRKQNLDNGGKVMVRNIEYIIEECVKNRDLEGLDVLSTLAYHQTGETKAYGKDKSLFISEIKNCAERNLFLKYTLSKEDYKYKSKIDILDDIIKEHKYDKYDIGTLRSRLIERTSELMRQNVNEIYIKLNKIDKIALNYILDNFLFKIKESREAAMKKGSLGFEYIDGSIHVEPRDSTDENNIIYFEITDFMQNLEESNHIYSIFKDKFFNINIKKKSLNRHIEYLPSCPTLGNLLVEAGLGYWTPWVTTNKKENVYYRLIVPKYLYDIAIEVIKSPPKPPEEKRGD